MPRVLRNSLLSVAVLLLVSSAVGQASYTARVRGIVSDQTGAVVQNATITITN